MEAEEAGVNSVSSTAFRFSCESQFGLCELVLQSYFQRQDMEQIKVMALCLLTGPKMISDSRSSQDYNLFLIDFPAI